MTILNNLMLQKSVQYNTIIEDNVYFSESISSVIQKIGTPENTEKCDTQTTLKYKRKLHSHIATEYYCFENGNLYSVCYETGALTDDESKHFLSEIENLINESALDGILRYRCCEKEYWELSDGAVAMHICLYIENNIAHIKIDYFD